MALSVRTYCRNNAVKHTLVITWLVINFVVFWQTYQHYKYEAEFYYLHEMLGAGLCISRGTANVLNLNLGALLLPMCRLSLAWIRGSWCKISRRTVRELLDHSKGFHILCGYIVVIASVIHFFGHVFNCRHFSEHYNRQFPAINAAKKPKESPLLIVLSSVPGITGLAMMLVLSLILSAASAAIRHTCYDLFWCSHRLYIVFYILLLVHGLRGILKAQQNTMKHIPGCKHMPGNDSGSLSAGGLNHDEAAFPEPFPETRLDGADDLCMEEPQFSTIGCSSWMWVVPSLFIYACDAMYSYIHHCCRGPAQVSSVTPHPGDVLEVQLYQKGLHIRPGQYVLVQCPSISVFEFHPYTVTKCPTNEDKRFSIHIKSAGDWSARVTTLLCGEDFRSSHHSTLPPQQQRTRRLYVEGPFGSPIEDILRYRISLCVAGGIGITPVIAILNHLLEDGHTGKLQRLYIMWMCRYSASFACFLPLLCDIHEKFWNMNRPDMISVQLYLTDTSNSNSETELNARYPLMWSRLRYGRPHWRENFMDIATSHPRDQVGVFTCGPRLLCRDVEYWCSRRYNSSTVFTHHHESY